ncbi:hypothetical protein [Marinagarivorans cellulosilyticus]|uniref:hypothetical protein n=1 Tax=Marinagarivorans cellulosilyticus TaxID=2721545 RepID=UPI001F16CBDA|nr:hypothetical protein [Marinagarivorans cellulosilyticus]
MTEVYLLQNNDGLFLNKHQEWVDGSDASGLYKTTFKDDAINTKVELTVKNPQLRIKTLLCATNDKGTPCLPTAPEPTENPVQQ